MLQASDFYGPVFVEASHRILLSLKMLARKQTQLSKLDYTLS